MTPASSALQVEKTLPCLSRVYTPPAGAGMMAVPRAYLQVGWLLGTVMLLGVVRWQLLVWYSWNMLVQQPATQLGQCLRASTIHKVHNDNSCVKHFSMSHYDSMVVGHVACSCRHSYFVSHIALCCIHWPLRSYHRTLSSSASFQTLPDLLLCDAACYARLP